MTRYTTLTDLRGMKVLILFLLLLPPSFMSGSDSAFVPQEVESAYYNVSIKRGENLITGMCILVNSGDTVKASIVNDFGATILDCSFYKKRSKIKLHYLFKSLNRWYLRPVLKRDLKEIMKIMSAGGTSYTDKKHKLDYTFVPNPLKR